MINRAFAQIPNTTDGRIALKVLRKNLSKEFTIRARGRSPDKVALKIDGKKSTNFSGYLPMKYAKELALYLYFRGKKGWLSLVENHQEYIDHLQEERMDLRLLVLWIHKENPEILMRYIMETESKIPNFGGTNE
jgi:hypothetical protein